MDNISVKHVINTLKSNVNY